MVTTVRNYLIQDLSEGEKLTYIEYIRGDEDASDWIEKANSRRDALLSQNLKCTTCESWISIRETGICKCSKGHECYEIIIDSINNLK